jgi:hypothetical protein
MKIFNNPTFKLQNTEKLGVFKSFSFANESDRKIALDLAEEALSFELTPLTATLYIDYARNGNRTRYETPYHARRTALHSLLLGCLADGDAKYTDKMVDIIWAILEETSWVIPAHNVAHPYELGGEPLSDSFGDDVVEVDLFSAETAALLSWVYHFEKDRLDAVTPVICKRIEYEIDRRILRPYRKLEMRWMTNFINNWTPWIVSNVLVTSAVFVKEWRELQFLIYVSMGYLDRFAETYGEDGGCDEGASYWNAAVAALFDATSILYDITGGALNKFDSPLLLRMCEYVPNVCISPDERIYANFADGPRHLTFDRRLFMRMGKLTGSEKLKRFAESLAMPQSFTLSRFMLYRELVNLTEPILEKKTAVDYADATVFYPNLQLSVLRRGDFFLAIKGGHNRESHNHNDIGSFILYHGATPVIIDAGVGVYTKDTFSDKRYTIWSMQSSYHNLPEIDGMMQLPGRKYRADDFSLDGDTVSVSYRGAYPDEMKATAVNRAVTVTDNKILIRDEIKDAESVIFNLLLCDAPEKIDGGFAVGGCHVLFDGDYTVDTVDISTDGSFRNDWGRNTLYRVRIPSTGTHETVITKGD